MKAHKQTDDTRLALLEQAIITMNDTLKRIESKVDGLSKEMKEGFKEVNNKMDTGFKDCNNRIWHNFYWNLAALVGLGALMAHGFKWY